jgi:hypothetical protein
MMHGALAETGNCPDKCPRKTFSPELRKCSCAAVTTPVRQSSPIVWASGAATCRNKPWFPRAMTAFWSTSSKRRPSSFFTAVRQES